MSPYDDTTFVTLADTLKVERDPDTGDVLVYGRATDSSKDADEQVCDPAWLKTAMPDWFTWGNVREQHDAKRAVGKAFEYEEKPDGHWIKARLVDPVAKAKAEAGIFTGLSVGISKPRVVKDEAAPGGRITGGRIVEVSVVDRPANPNCVLTVVKAAAEGQEVAPEDYDEERGLIRVSELSQIDDAAKALGVTPADLRAYLDARAAPPAPPDAPPAPDTQKVEGLDTDTIIKGIMDSESMKALTGAAERVERSLGDLTKRLETVEKMASPGGPARTRTDAGDTAKARELDNLRIEAQKYRDLATQVEDSERSRAYLTLAAQCDSRASTLSDRTR